MLEYVKCMNFKVFRDAALPLGPLTLLLGPNGSGKTTLLQAIGGAAYLGNTVSTQQMTSFFGPMDYAAVRSIGTSDAVFVEVGWQVDDTKGATRHQWGPNTLPGQGRRIVNRDGTPLKLDARKAIEIESRLGRIRFFTLDASAIGLAAPIHPEATLAPNGGGLPAVLDRLRDQNYERFKALEDEMGRWLPEYDRITFDVPPNPPGHKVLGLRTRRGGHSIPAQQLSQGTLFSLVLLTLAYLPDPPPFLALEEVDRGIHPRLFRDVQGALYRLTHPADFGDPRPAVQVVATTHSPYLLDLYKDHPEQIAIAHKKGNEAYFERLCDRSDVEEIVGSAPLGELWFSGVLGGVPGER